VRRWLDAFGGAAGGGDELRAGGDADEPAAGVRPEREVDGAGGPAVDVDDPIGPAFDPYTLSTPTPRKLVGCWMDQAGLRTLIVPQVWAVDAAHDDLQQLRKALDGSRLVTTSARFECRWEQALDLESVLDQARRIALESPALCIERLRTQWRRESCTAPVAARWLRFVLMNPSGVRLSTLGERTHPCNLSTPWTNCKDDDPSRHRQRCRKAPWCCRDFIHTYLERDVALLVPRVPATTLERLWTMLAHRQGTTLNVSALARGLELGTQSLTRYIDLIGEDALDVALRQR